jgi:cytochrome c-type biogenesis protein
MLHHIAAQSREGEPGGLDPAAGWAYIGAGGRGRCRLPARRSALLEVTWGAALLAGLVSFITPCVLPLVPAYLCYLAGVSMDELAAKGERREASRAVVASALAFVMGFTTVFVMLGATASAFGQLVMQHVDVLAVVAGIIIIVMGLHFLGLFRIALLYREARLQVKRRPPGILGAYVIGLAFAFGWTPCIGPVLGAILFVAGAEETVTRGASLLAVYSLGLGIPFVLAAAFAGPFLRWSERFKPHLGKVEKGMGGALVVTGILFITGTMTTMAFWLLETFPALGQIG